jgi:hypothetical protein
VNDTSADKTLTGDLGLTWTARETTDISITASRSQRLSSNDLTVVATTAKLGVEQKLRYNLSATADANYTWSTYRTIARSDEIFMTEGALHYTFGHGWNASGSYSYQTSRSDTTVAQYVRHVATVSVGYTY